MDGGGRREEERDGDSRMSVREGGHVQWLSRPLVQLAGFRSRTSVARGG